MKRILLAMSLLSFLFGCSASSETPDPSTEKLKWLETADAQQDAKKAIEAGDFHLLGLAARNINIPGIDQADNDKYEKACGVKLIDGVSDVVRSDEHLRLIQKARSYALEYNNVIKTKCKP